MQDLATVKNALKAVQLPGADSETARMVPAYQVLFKELTRTPLEKYAHSQITDSDLSEALLPIAEHLTSTATLLPLAVDMAFEVARHSITSFHDTLKYSQGMKEPSGWRTTLVEGEGWEEAFPQFLRGSKATVIWSTAMKALFARDPLQALKTGECQLASLPNTEGWKFQRTKIRTTLDELTELSGTIPPRLQPKDTALVPA